MALRPAGVWKSKNTRNLKKLQNFSKEGADLYKVVIYLKVFYKTIKVHSFVHTIYITKSETKAPETSQTKLISKSICCFIGPSFLAALNLSSNTRNSIHFVLIERNSASSVFLAYQQFLVFHC